MKFEITSVDIDIPKNLKKVDNDAFWKFAANEWWKLITPFVPMDTGTLFESVHITPGQIEYYQPYARRVYEGDHINFHKDHHPLASARWNIVAKPTEYPKLINTLQEYIDQKLNQ